MGYAYAVNGTGGGGGSEVTEPTDWPDGWTWNGPPDGGLYNTAPWPSGWPDDYLANIKDVCTVAISGGISSTIASEVTVTTTFYEGTATTRYENLACILYAKDEAGDYVKLKDTAGDEFSAAIYGHVGDGLSTATFGTVYFDTSELSDGETVTLYAWIDRQLVYDAEGDPEANPPYFTYDDTVTFNNSDYATLDTSQTPPTVSSGVTYQVIGSEDVEYGLYSALTNLAEASAFQIQSVAADSNYAYIANDESILYQPPRLRILDKDDLSTLVTANFATRAHSFNCIVVDDTHLYAVKSGNMVKRLKSDLSSVADVSQAYMGKRIVEDGDYIYSFVGTTASKFSKSNLGYLGGATIQGGTYQGGLCVDSTGTYLYVQSSQYISKVLISSMTEVDYLYNDQYLYKPSNSNICADESYVYATTSARDSVVKVRASDMTIVASQIGSTLWNYATGICEDGNYVYVVASNTIYKLNKSDLSIAASIYSNRLTVADRTTIVVEGNYLYVACGHSSRYVLKFSK